MNRLSADDFALAGQSFDRKRQHRHRRPVHRLLVAIAGQLSRAGLTACLLTLPGPAAGQEFPFPNEPPACDYASVDEPLELPCASVAVIKAPLLDLSEPWCRFEAALHREGSDWEFDGKTLACARELVAITACSPDPKLRYAAVRKIICDNLDWRGDPTSSSGAEQCLLRGPADLSLPSVAQALGMVGGSRSRPFLEAIVDSRAIGRAEGPELIPAIIALGSLGDLDDDFVGKLIDWTGSSSYSLRTGAIQGMVNAVSLPNGRAALNRSAREALEARMIEMLEEGNDLGMALMLVGTTESACEPCLAAYVRLACSESEFKSSEALSGLQSMGSRAAPAVPQLRSLLHSEHPIQPLEVLAAIGPAAAAAVPDIVQLLRDGEARRWLPWRPGEQRVEVWIAAARALGRIGVASPEVLEVLQSGMSQHDPRIRGTCIDAWARIAPPTRESVGAIVTSTCMEHRGWSNISQLDVRFGIQRLAERGAPWRDEVDSALKHPVHCTGFNQLRWAAEHVERP